MIETIFLYARTIRFLKPIQLIHRLRRMWPIRHNSLSSVPEVRGSVNALIPGVPKPSSMVGPNRFKFLNVVDELPDGADWSGAGNSLLWQYNLHYFDWLNAPADAGRMELNQQFLLRWIRSQPCGSPTSWDPYPTSLRIVNWIKFHHATGLLDAEALESLAQQGHWLEKNLEWHLLGNHLFVNAKALVAAGCFFDGARARGWLSKGLEILDRQLAEQLLEDGGHFELSPMYHALILEDLLDLLALIKAYQLPELLSRQERLTSVAQQMLGWLQLMSHPDGGISFFNDAAFGVSPDIASLTDYARRLDLKVSEMTLAALKPLPSCGYYRVDHGPFTLITDMAEIGPSYIPGHGHADCLSFELSIGDIRVFVNGGTSTYSPGPTRLYERGTRAHNTVMIDGQNSSEVWASFRVGRRAIPRGVSCRHLGEEIRLEASHDGYRHLSGKPVHHRKWICREDQLVIEDTVSSLRHSAEVRYILHPHISVCEKKPGWFTLSLPDGNALNFNLPGGRIEEVYHAPEFGLQLATSAILASLVDGFCRASLSFCHES